MEIKAIEERIQEYQPTNKIEELNAFKEIVQEITLSALSRADFFKHAAFQGGTALRIVYGLNRFSEDMDFVLLEPNPNFHWSEYFEEIQLEFKGYGFHLEVTDRSKASSNVKKAFLKENSFGQILQLSYERTRSDPQVVLIKLEVDVNPPLDSGFETKNIRFPEPFSIVVQDLPSLFAGKLHALLCREYVKGRDWYDFIWYVSRKTPINLQNLQNALIQQGPWKGSAVEVDHKFVVDQLREKVRNIDWDMAKKDVQPFLRKRQSTTLNLWSSDFFEDFIDSLMRD